MCKEDDCICRTTIIDAYEDILERGAPPESACAASLDAYRRHHPNATPYENLDTVKAVLGPRWPTSERGTRRRGLDRIRS